MTRAVPLIATAILSFVASAEGQLSVSGKVGYLDRRLSDRGIVERQAGAVGGGVVTLVSGRVAVSITASGGRLSAQTRDTPDVDYGGITGEVFVAPTKWLALYGGARLSAYVSSLGTQRWILPRVGAELRAPFASIPGKVFLRVAALVGTTTNGPTSASGGAIIGGGLAVGRGKFRFFADYQLERLNFTTGDAREEQWGEVSAGVRVIL